MVKKNKFLAASDIEGDTKAAKSLAEKAEKESVDLVILCGDITGWRETPGLIKPFKERNLNVLMVPGNHDYFEEIDYLASLYKIENIHGNSKKHKDIGFFGAGGAHIFPGFITENELKKTLDKAHKKIEGIEKKIMITHMHPAGSKSEFSGFEGSKAIRNAIKKFKPSFLLHGHIHEAAGMEEMIYETRVINVGKKGKIIEI